VAQHNTQREPGKRGRVIGIVETTPATQELAEEEAVEIISPTVDVNNATTNNNIVDLYSVGHKEVTRDMCDRGIEVPFQYTGPTGRVRQDIGTIRWLCNGSSNVRNSVRKSQT
jgi:hypothetical protein